MRALSLFMLLVIISNITKGQQQTESKKVMDGFPPSRESQVSFLNYRDYPYSKWSFRNMGATRNVLMIPREGPVYIFKESVNNIVGDTKVTDSTAFESTFANNEADGVIVIQNNTILFEKYWNGLSRHYQHIWFSMTKSLTSAALGLLVVENKVDVNASPVKYVPELKGTPWERTTIQDVLNMSTALDYQESYTDTSSFFYKHYGGATGFFPAT